MIERLPQIAVVGFPNVGTTRAFRPAARRAGCEPIDIVVQPVVHRRKSLLARRHGLRP